MDADKKEEIKQELPEDKFVYKRDSHKTLREIATETKEKLKKKKEEPKKEEEVKKDDTKVDTPPPTESTEKKEDIPKEDPKIDHEALARKAAEEAAQKVAEDTKASFREEIEKILNKDKDIEAKQKEADDLVAVWEKENRLPKDWKEIASEQLRISNAKIEQALKAERTAREAKQKEERQTAEKQRNDAQQQEKGKLEDFQRQIASDLDEIYGAKFLPKPANLEEINNPNTTDPAAKQTQEVLEFGVKLNTERTKQNLPPITSLNKIFFLHYQPFKASQIKKDAQPAGADAPISGAKNTPNTESKKVFVYARDHNKSFHQLAAEIKAEQKRR